MSEEQVSEQTSTTESQAPESTGTPSLLSGPSRTESPLDAVYAEGVLDGLPDGGVKNWLQSQKNGIGLENGLAHLQKLGSSKGLEKPGEGADEEAVNAYNSKIKEAWGVPDSAEAYEITLEEGRSLPDEASVAVKKLALENNLNQEQLNGLLPMFDAVTEAINKEAEAAHFKAEDAKLVEMFGGESEYQKAIPGVLEFAKAQGIDAGSMAAKHAEFWGLASKLMAANQKIAELTGESPSIQGGGVSVGSLDDLQKQLNDLQFGEGDMSKAFRNPATNMQLARKANAEFISLNKKIAAAKSKMG